MLALSLVLLALLTWLELWCLLCGFCVLSFKSPIKFILPEEGQGATQCHGEGIVQSDGV